MAQAVTRVRTAALALLAGVLLSACGAAQPAQIAVEPTIVATAAAEPARAPLVAPTTNDIQPAEEEGRVLLIAFLTAMHQGGYADAAAMFGGDYQYLQSYNRDLSVDDHAALLQRACEANSFLCLEPLTVEVAATEGETMFYDVTFRARDGSIFATSAPGNPSDRNSVYRLRVTWTPDGLRVLDMPPFSS